MHKNVGALSALCVAIAAAMVAPVSAAEPVAEAVPVAQTQDAAQPAQDQGDTSDQTAPKKKQDASSQSQAEATKLGTITVTATQRKEELQKVPVPVSVLTYHDIQRQHLQDFMDYTASIPGLNVVSGQPGITGLSIRGIASGSSQPSGSVGIYVDETPYGSSSVFAGGGALSLDLDPADLERIEVLRGPQGTLYGAGALGGVLRFITIPPDTENSYGRLQVGGTDVSGGGAGYNVSAMFNAPLVTDQLALRANVYDTTTPGFIDDAGLGKTNVNKTEVKGGRATLLWTPSAATSVSMMVLAQNLNGDGSPTEALDPVTLKPVYGDLQQRAAADTGYFDAQYRLYNLTLNTDFGWATLMSSTSYSTLNSVANLDVTPLLYLGPQANGQPYGTLENEPIHQTKATQEFRLASPTSQTVEWLGGFFFTHEIGNVAQDIYPSDYYTGVPQDSPFGIPIGGTSQPSSYIAYAAYGSLTWHLNDRWDVEAGLRYSHDSQHYTEVGYGVLVGGLPPTVLLDKDSSDNSTTFSITPQFHINDNNMLYLRIASGFLPGGPNIVAPGAVGVPQTFSPTELTDYDLGLKSTAADGRVITDLSLYYIDWTKIPLTTFISPYTFLTSAGQAESTGVEASIAFLVTQGLKFSVATAYNNAHLTKDAPFPSNGMSGDPLPYAPKFTLGLNGDYDFAMGGGWHGYVGAGYQYIDKRSTDFAFSDPTGVLAPLPASPTIPSYYTINLRAGMNRDQWSIDAYIKNLTNQHGIVQASTWQNAVAVAGALNPVTGVVEDNATIITPRTFGLSATWHF